MSKFQCDTLFPQTFTDQKWVLLDCITDETLGGHTWKGQLNLSVLQGGGGVKLLHGVIDEALGRHTWKGKLNLVSLGERGEVYSIVSQMKILVNSLEKESWTSFPWGRGVRFTPLYHRWRSWWTALKKRVEPLFPGGEGSGLLHCIKNHTIISPLLNDKFCLTSSSSTCNFIHNPVTLLLNNNCYFLTDLGSTGGTAVPEGHSTVFVLSPHRQHTPSGGRSLWLSSQSLGNLVFIFNNFTFCPKGVVYKRNSRSHARCSPA